MHIVGLAGGHRVSVNNFENKPTRAFWFTFNFEKIFFPTLNSSAKRMLGDIVERGQNREQGGGRQQGGGGGGGGYGGGGFGGGGGQRQGGFERR